MLKNYPASLDSLSKIITGFVSVLFVGIIIQMFWLMQNQNKLILTGVIALIIAVYFFCYLYKIDSYSIHTDSLHIERPVGRKIIQIASIKEVIIPTDKSMRWSVRTFGNGGLFGYWGYFSNTTYGSMKWYATRRSHYILLRLENQDKIIITPDDLSLALDIQKLIKV